MAGSAICRAFERAGYHQLLTASRSELDPSNSSEVEAIRGAPTHGGGASCREGGRYSSQQQLSC